MLTSWLPWDFIGNRPYLITPEQRGLYAFWAYDPFIEKILLNRFSRFLRSEKGPRVALGNEISIDWIESNLLTPDLFGSKDSYSILQAEDLPQSSKNYLLEVKPVIDDRYLLFSFSREDKFFNQLASQPEITALKIDSHRFWETDKLLALLSDELNIRLPYMIQSYLLESVPNNPADLIAALKRLKLHLESTKTELTLENIRELILPSRLDHFHLASLLGSKKKSEFYKKIIETDCEIEGLRSLFSFMQGHLLRLADTSYMDKKKRLSKYDKEVAAHAKLWDLAELKNEIRNFAQLEISAKEKSFFLKEQLRLAYLSTF